MDNLNSIATDLLDDDNVISVDARSLSHETIVNLVAVAEKRLENTDNCTRIKHLLFANVSWNEQLDQLCQNGNSDVTIAISKYFAFKDEQVKLGLLKQIRLSI